jgi:hypothetical protein
VGEETGDVKKGTHTVGVQRQYTGTAGRIESSQVAVYAGERGHAAVDRELYIPRSWTCDPDRCRAAGLDQDTVFATKPDLARTMIERFLDAGHHVGWVTGDEVYGGNPRLRRALEERGIGYVLAVACSAELPTVAGDFGADALARKVPKRAWQKLSAGRGSKGQRFYDWAVIDLAEPAPGRHQLLIRRNRSTSVNSPTTALTPPHRHPSPPWSRSQVPDGGWKRPSKPRRDWPGSMNTRSAATPRGPAGSPSQCWPTPSSPSSAPTNTHTGTRRTTWSRCPATRSAACSSRSSSGPSTTRPTGLPGPTGDAATRRDHAPVTTGDKPHPGHEDHDLQLEY